MTDKMTIQEAITELNECYLVQSDDEGRRRNKAVTMAIESLEKQIPTKTEVDERCPACFSLLNMQDRCCGQCGQVIDWESDTE